jgi:uncharacterized membrane protein YagU involved in acid resistance
LDDRSHVGHQQNIGDLYMFFFENAKVTPNWFMWKHHWVVRYIIWLVVYLSLWKIWKSVRMMTFPIYGQIIQMFQTINQTFCWS